MPERAVNVACSDRAANLIGVVFDLVGYVIVDFVDAFLKVAQSRREPGVEIVDLHPVNGPHHPRPSHANRVQPVS